MKTRIDLWRKYREEINSNIELQKSVQHSNEKLKVLYKRLLDVFPDYEKKHQINLSKVKINTEEMGFAPKISNDNILNLINDIEESLEFDSSSFKAIDNLDFSSHELDDVLEDIKKKKMSKEVVKSKEITQGMIINNEKIVDLNKKDSSLKRKINIAIDGPSGSGKSTVAKIIANKYNLKYINTGLVYRAIALNVLEEKADVENREEVIRTLKDDMIVLDYNETVLLNGVDVSKQVRADEVSVAASKVASISEVREWAVKLQKEYAKENGVVMDGRDTTFKIMPHADLKIFLETKPEVRAKRRMEQNKKMGYSTDYEKILKEIEERDKRDRNRKVDPLHKTKDAILIDASTMDIDEVVLKISVEVDKII